MAEMAERCSVPDLRAGDPTAWERLFHSWYPVAYRTAYLITHDSGRAEDAIQDAFCHAIRGIGRLRDPERLRAWLQVIVSRAAIDQVRRNSARRDTVVADVDDAASRSAANGCAPSAMPNPEEAAMAKARAETVMAALQDLPPDFRQVTVLFYYHQLSIAEIAAELACPEGTVKSRLNRARARLQSVLEPALEERLHG